MSTVIHPAAGVPTASPAAQQRQATAASRPHVWRQPRTDAAALIPPSARDTLDGSPPRTDPPDTDALLADMGELGPGDPRRAAVRDHAIETCLPMAVHLAHRFTGRGEPLADLIQVAVVGLIKSIDRYDATRGVPFTSFAFPTILGEIKRHFRDTGWNVRVPRPLQELRLHLTTVTEELVSVLYRQPTTAELATGLGISRAEVQAAQHVAAAYRALSLDQPLSGTQDMFLIDSLGGPDPGIEAVDRRETMRQGLTKLPERERRILAMRYFAEMTQTQIAAEIGVSQMHISRLMARSLARLRTEMLADAQ